MVIINMSSMPLKVIGRESNLCAKIPYGPSKNPKLKKSPNV
jgi:hypothetical protein